MANYSSVYLAIVSISVFVGGAIADDTPATREIKCPIEISSNGRLAGYAFVGLTKHGMQLPVNLTIQNLTNAELHFDDPESDCGCAKVETKDKVIKPHGTIEVSVLVNTPKNPQSTKFRTALRFNKAKQPEPVFTIALEFELSNVLAFKGQMVMVEVPAVGKAYDFVVPLVKGADVQAKDIEVSVNGLPFLSAEFQEEPDRLVCSVSRTQVPDTAVSGSLILRNRSTGDTHSLPCYVEKSGATKVFPAVLRLTQEDQGFVGSLLVKIADGEEDSENALRGVPVAANVLAECPGFHVSTESKPIGGDLTRVEISLKKIDAEDNVPFPSKLRLFCPQPSFKFSKWVDIAPIE